MGNVMDNGFVNWYMDYDFELYFIGLYFDFDFDLVI